MWQNPGRGGGGGGGGGGGKGGSKNFENFDRILEKKNLVEKIVDLDFGRSEV